MSHAEKRRYIRFEPDPTDFVKIDLDPDRETFMFQYLALLVEESPRGGCGIVGLMNIGLKKGAKIKVGVGRMAPLLAEVVWERKLDDEVYRYGLRFLE